MGTFSEKELLKKYRDKRKEIENER